jgi:hypothetical protein
MDIPKKLKENLDQGWEAIKYDNETFAYLFPAAEIIRGEFEAYLYELQAEFIRLRQKDNIVVEPAVPLGKAPKMGTQVTLKVFGRDYTWYFTISRQKDNAELSVCTGNLDRPVRTITWPIRESTTKEAEIRAFIQTGCDELLKGIDKDLFANETNGNES